MIDREVLARPPAGGKAAARGRELMADRVAQGSRGILAYGGYVPLGRLDRGDIAATLGPPAGRGTRAVASHDEDSTTLAVEAARVALRRAPVDAQPSALVFSTTSPTYLDRTNATAVHAAL